MTSYGSVATLERNDGPSSRSVRRTAMLVAGVGSMALLGLVALVAAGSSSEQTVLFGWGYPSMGYGGASQWMQPQMPMQEMGPRLVQLAGGGQNMPNQFAAAFPPAQSEDRSSYIKNLGKTAQTLEDQEKALEANKLKVAQEKEDVQHLYQAAVKAREENKARRAREAEDQAVTTVQHNARVHGMPWQSEMGTDISFINTAKFPGSMKGAWHHNGPFEGGEGAEALHPDASAGRGNGAAAPDTESTKAALQLAVQEKVDLDAAKTEIKMLKDEMLKDKLSGSSSKSAKAPPQQQQRKTKAAPKAQQLRMMQMQRPQPWRRAVRVMPVHAQRMAQAGAAAKLVSEPSGNDKFKDALARFIGQAGLVKMGNSKAPKRANGLKGKVVQGNQKTLFDYNLDSQADEGEDVWPYKEGATKGSPCAVSGACNHHPEDQPFNLQDDEFHAKRIEDRFKEPKEEEEPEEVVKLGDSQVGGSFDDYVTPEDAYIHNLLTSSAPGIDHFGHLAPLSKANMNIMYGPEWHTLEHDVEGHKLHSDGRGGLSSTAAEDEQAAEEEDADGEFYHDHRPAVALGDDQIGGHDQEVPTALSMPAFPGSDPDHFDHWAHDDPKNMELLNGRYWKYLKKDGILDRMTPATEAYKQQSAASHDRTLADTWGSVPHYYGFETAGGFKEARETAQGEDWHDQVFTGTDESMEDHAGTHGSDTEFFKGKKPTVLSKTK